MLHVHVYVLQHMFTVHVHFVLFACEIIATHRIRVFILSPFNSLPTCLTTSFV